MGLDDPWGQPLPTIEQIDKLRALDVYDWYLVNTFDKAAGMIELLTTKKDKHDAE